MIFLYDNKVPTSLIVASTQASRFKFTDALLDSRLSRRGRTNSGSGEYLVFFLTGASLVDYCIISGHNLTASAQVYLQGNSSNSWASPAYSQQLTISDTIIQAVGETYQYWRLTFTDVTDYIEIANVFLGAGLAGPGMDQSQILNVKTSSNFSKSDSFQLYGNKKSDAKAAEIQFPLVSNTMRKSINSMFNVVGVHTPFYLLFWESDLDVEPPFYCNFLEAPSFSRVASSNVWWSFKISIEECK